MVEQLLDRTGIAVRGDLGACRWVAIRHAPDHVHVAAVLVRQDDGRRVWPHNDYLRAGQVCRAAEVRLGLTRTAAADRTVVGQATRAEVEKAARRGVAEPSRDWLRRAARVAAVQTRDPEAFFTRLEELGVEVAAAARRGWSAHRLPGGRSRPGDGDRDGRAGVVRRAHPGAGSVVAEAAGAVGVRAGAGGAAACPG